MDNPCGMSRQNRSPSKSVPEDFQPIEPYCDAAIAPAFQIEGQLNEVYEKRLAEINEEANGDPTLKEITYKEWITMLREINKTLITNIQDMERETTERLALLQRKVSANCRLSNQSSELCKYRRDIAGLMQLIRNGKQYGDWNIDKYCFETITAKDIFGTDLPCCDPNLNKIEPESTDQSECAVKGTGTKLKTKLLDNVKALAYEVADKHDEIRDLKKQILSMEDEIQKAQKKIQLKDDVIKELRNDLKALPKFVGAWNCRTTDHASPTSSGLSASIMSDIKSECEMTTPRVVESYSNRDSIHSLTTSPLEEDEDDEQNFIKCLREELNQLFEMRRSYDQNVEDQKRSIQEQQTRLCDMVEKLLKCNSQFHNKLRFYRRELLNLDNPQHNNRTCSIASDCDSGISSDSDPDVKIINSVRNRVSNFIDENQRLRKCQQLMQIEFEDVSCKLLAKSEIFDKTSKALREVTDALSNAICKPIAYEKMFGQCQSMSNNPIVDAVDGLMETVKIRDQTINDLRKELADARRSNEELDCCCKTLKLELADMKQLTPANIQSENRVMLFQNQEFSKRLLKQVALRPCEDHKKHNLVLQNRFISDSQPYPVIILNLG